MDKTLLVREKIEEGKKLIEAIDRSDFQLTGALWFYLVENNDWRLILVTPLLEISGPRKIYEKIQLLIRDLPTPFGIGLENISVMSPHDKLIKLLRIAIRTSPGLSEIRFSKNTINNVFIEDAIIYRLT